MSAFFLVGDGYFRNLTPKHVGRLRALLRHRTLQVPDLGGVGGVFKYLGKVVSLAPEQRDEKGVPQARAQRVTGWTSEN